ncbi:hypothetical protein B0H13DRAFT_2330844 [Mycena leptocephala]|nr:hypothetical protein B0H13DRAFT_2330844 [Mycena leptocephala]
MVDTIILWTVETTLLTTISGALQLILFLTRRHDLSWLVFFLIQAKLFSNSMLASLNGRTQFRQTAGTSRVVAFDSTAQQHSVRDFTYSCFLTKTLTGRIPNVVIRMHQMSETAYSQDMARSRTDKEDF